jgi:hypothetical protein
VGIKHGAWASGWMDATVGPSCRPYRESKPQVAAAAAALARSLASVSNRSGAKVSRAHKSKHIASICNHVSAYPSPPAPLAAPVAAPVAFADAYMGGGVAWVAAEVGAELAAVPSHSVAPSAFALPATRAQPSRDQMTTYASSSSIPDAARQHEPARDWSASAVRSTPPAMAMAMASASHGQALPATEAPRLGRGTGLPPMSGGLSYSSRPDAMGNSSGYNDFIKGLERGVAKQAHFAKQSTVKNEKNGSRSKAAILLPSGIQTRVQTDVVHVTNYLKSLGTPVSL